MSLENCIARICNSAGETKGTCFLIKKRSLLTCAHVLGACDAAVGDTVCVRFHVSEESCSYTARVLDYFPPEQGDLALLVLDKDPPCGFEIACFAQVAPRECEFQSWGYPRYTELEPEFRHAEGRVTFLSGLSTDFDFQLFEENIITCGFSGAPIFDKSWSNVVGIVGGFDTSDSYGRSPRSALGISVNKIFLAYPNLKPKPRLPDVIQRDYKSITLASKVYTFCIDYLEEDFSEDFTRRLQRLRHPLEQEACTAQIALESWDDGFSEDLREASAEVCARCGLLLWWNVDVIICLCNYVDIEIYDRVTDKVRQLFRWLSCSPLVNSEENRHSYIPPLRFGLQEYVKGQSLRTWRDLHENLASFWEQQDPRDYESNCRFNVCYHKLCAQQVGALGKILQEIGDMLFSSAFVECQDVNSCLHETSVFLYEFSAIFADAAKVTHDDNLKSWAQQLDRGAAFFQQLNGSIIFQLSGGEGLMLPELLDCFWEPLTTDETFSQFDFGFK